MSCFGSPGHGWAGACRHTFAAKDHVMFARKATVERPMCTHIDALDAGNCRVGRKTAFTTNRLIVFGGNEKGHRSALYPMNTSVVVAADRHVRGGLFLRKMAVGFAQALAERRLLRLGHVVDKLFKLLFQPR